MRIRRCTAVLIDPREEVEFDFNQLLQGTSGLRTQRRWLALAAHLGREVELLPEQVLALRELPQIEWQERDVLLQRIPAALLDSLLDLGLAICAEGGNSEARRLDEQLRATGWHPLFAAAHQFGRWKDTDSSARAAEAGINDIDDLLKQLGPSPSATVERGELSATIALPQSADTGLDALLRQRATCRNFDPEARLELPALAQLLRRVFGAQAVHELRPGHTVLRKTSPSGGCLHPTEAHLLAQRVDGLDCGIYHYQPASNALAPMRRTSPTELAELGLLGLAGQRYFADAAALLVLTCRFDRHYWKYRHHAKAYRAMMLDAGHLSQTLFLSAAEQGLGAFVTAAINEIPLEQALGVDPLQEGVIAMCGIGPRSATRREFDFAAAELTSAGSN